MYDHSRLWSQVERASTASSHSLLSTNSLPHSLDCESRIWDAEGALSGALQLPTLDQLELRSMYSRAFGPYSTIQ
jgi:hypothetical protein